MPLQALQETEHQYDPESFCCHSLPVFLCMVAFPSLSQQIKRCDSFKSLLRTLTASNQTSRSLERVTSRSGMVSMVMQTWSNAASPSELCVNSRVKDQSILQSPQLAGRGACPHRSALQLGLNHITTSVVQLFVDQASWSYQSLLQLCMRA